MTVRLRGHPINSSLHFYSLLHVDHLVVYQISFYLIERDLLTTLMPLMELIIDLHGLGMLILKLLLDQIFDSALYEWVLHDYLMHSTFINRPLGSLISTHTAASCLLSIALSK